MGKYAKLFQTVIGILIGFLAGYLIRGSYENHLTIDLGMVFGSIAIVAVLFFIKEIYVNRRK